MIELAGDRIRLRAFRPGEHDRFFAYRMALPEGIAITTVPETGSGSEPAGRAS